MSQLKVSVRTAESGPQRLKPCPLGDKSYHTDSKLRLPERVAPGHRGFGT
jgi:hypothetical protein